MRLARRLLAVPTVMLALFLASAGATADDSLDAKIDGYAHMALDRDPVERRAAVEWLIDKGGTGAVAPLIQLMRWTPEYEDVIARGLSRITGAQGGDWFDWMLWQQEHAEIRPYAGFTGFTSDVLALIDERFRRFIRSDIPFSIRIEEVAWGGVTVDGIPSLDNPTMIAATAADYLNDDDLVFGAAINGDARAYPLRILNWHEMANDVIGGVPVSLAYCTLCGAGILFDGRVPGRTEPFTFGSSGLLYRSNKLMYDRQTDSLWNQFTGRPVSGVLFDSGIELKVLPLEIANWADWRARHPKTLVVSLETGHLRDYGPGVAYREYFASPDLMFPAVLAGRELAPKDIVFGVRMPGGVKAWPLSKFEAGQVFNERVGFVDVVLFGEAATRNVRAYERRGREFRPGAAADELSDGKMVWQVTDEALISSTGESLPRVPGHLAFWFAWAGYFEAKTLGQE